MNFRNTLSTAAVSLAFVLAACPSPTPPTPVAPTPATVLSFTVAPEEAGQGDTVTLTWEVEDATELTIHALAGEAIPLDEPGRLRGSTTVEVDATTTFVLTAYGEGGSDSAAARVIVPEAAEQLFFGAFPPEVPAGGEVTLAWQVTAAPVTITDASGAVVHSGDKAFGSAVVRPANSTTYTLVASGQTATTQVQVTPKIHSFESDVPSAGPEDEVTLTWAVGGATRVTLTDDKRGHRVTFEDPATISDGTFVDTIPADLAAKNTFVRYTLTAEQGLHTVTQEVTIWSGTDPHINVFEVPPYGLEGGSFAVRWEVFEADQVEVLIDGQPRFVATRPEEVANHSVLLPTPAALAQVTLRVWNARGGEATASLPVEPVGQTQLHAFAASPDMVATAGTGTTLSWHVENARWVRISVKDRYVLHTASGHAAEQGSITIYPNGPTEYLLEADNTVGSSIFPATATASSATVGTLSFSPAKSPYGGEVTISGAPLAGTLQAFDFAVKNDPSESFVDISQDGQTTGHPVSTAYTMQVVDLGEEFTFPIRDQQVSATQIAVNNRGWFSLDPTAAHVSTTPPSTWDSQLLPPLAFAPYWELLQKDASAELYWRLDGQGPDRRLIVQWNNVRYSSTTTKRMTFQAQVYASGKVVFAYPEVYAWTLAGDTPSIGIVGLDGIEVLRPRVHQFDVDMRPVSGDTFTFFSAVPPGYDVGAYPETYTVLVQTASGEVMGVSGSPEILLPGQFWISEAMPAPDATTAPLGEWFEVTNATDEAHDLSGWRISFGQQVHTIPASANLVLQPGGNLLFAQSANLLDNGGIVPDYVWGSGLSMTDIIGTIVLSQGNAVYDTATYSSTSGHSNGQSFRRAAVLLDHMYQAGVDNLTCAGTGTYGSQVGTPGTRSPSCFPYRREFTLQGTFEPIENTGTKLNGTQTQDFIVTLSTGDSTLPAPIKWGNGLYNTLTVSDNGFIALRDVPNEPVFACTVTNCHSANKTSFSATAPVRLIAPFWDTLSFPTGTGGIYMERKDPDPGLTGDEYTIISWEHIRYSTTAAYDLNFQVKFFDTGDIEYHYGVMDGSSETTRRGNLATIWLESEDGQAALVQNITSNFGSLIEPNSAVKFRFVD